MAVDPRPDARLAERGVRPVVALPRSALQGWMIAAGMVLAGLLLFSVLDARRKAATAPAVKPRAADVSGAPAPPPALFVPPVPEPVVLPVPVAAPVPTLPAPAPLILPPPPRRQYSRPPEADMPPPPVMQPPMRARGNAEAALVYDGTAGEPAEEAAAGAAVVAGGRSRAGMLRNRPTTVPQGTLIPAVLETAFDSTRPGLARALVSRDVHGFDGSRVLIPRGSRLIGQYQADLQPGQKRALVNWTRLVRPDGVTIAIGSPAADPLGRAGVRGKVDSHFFERFGAAILQSALDIGVNVASRAGSGNNAGVVVALPGAMQGVSPLAGNQVQPTLRIRQGSAITVFVARDLDFTSVEARR